MKLIIGLLIAIFAIPESNWVYKKSNSDLASWQASTGYEYFDKARKKQIHNYFVLGCHKNLPFVEFHSEKFLGNVGNKLPIMITFDTSTPFSENWKIKSPHVLFKKASNRKIISFITNINNIIQFKTRIDPYGSLPMVSYFKLDGITKVVSKIKAECPDKIKYWELKNK